MFFVLHLTEITLGMDLFAVSETGGACKATEIVQLHVWADQF